MIYYKILFIIITS